MRKFAIRYEDAEFHVVDPLDGTEKFVLDAYLGNFRGRLEEKKYQFIVFLN